MSTRGCGCGYFASGSVNRIVSTCDVSAPTSIRYSTRKLRIMNAAPASSTSVSVTSATISALVHRRARGPPVPERPPASFNTSFTSVLETCSAGASPNNTPVATQMPARNPITIGSIVNFIQYGLASVGSLSIASIVRMPATPRANPITPLPIDNTRLDEQLPHDPPAAGAERDANGDFTRALRRARQQQVGDIGARDQQYEAD